MKIIKSLYARVAVLSFALMLMYGHASAQCSTQIGNYSTCPGKFLSITSNNCESNPGGGYTTYIISVSVNQPGVYYTASAINARIVSSYTSETTLTYVIETQPLTASLGLMVTMGGSCSNQNFARITIE